MAQWSRSDRTLHTKLVYYGPAYGGKTTNLESLHRITDPHRVNQLLSLQTVNDRTLFFELLPFEIGDILGYQMAMKIYTVPGQVRYDTTRQVVLAGTDAIVFVADSSSDRRDQNVWSLQNLRMNMRAKRLDPSRIPILFQCNKQDLPCAVPIPEVASWLGVPPERVLPAVATEGRGVLETYMAACRVMLESMVARADSRTRREINPSDLRRQLDHAFSPYLARREHGAVPPPEAKPKGAEIQKPVVLEGDELLERSVQTSVRLGEKLTTEAARAGRLEREADALRGLSDSLRSVGASFERERIIDAALDTTQRILEAPVVSLMRETSSGHVVLERTRGTSTDPLLAFDGGAALARRIMASGRACVIDELARDCGPEAPSFLGDLRAAIVAPLATDEDRGALLAYATEPDAALGKQDLRFLATVAGHLAAGLEKARLHDQLAAHRDRLEETVAARTEQLREAYRSLRQMERMKDRFLSNLSDEIKTPLSAILSAAHTVRDYKSSAKERRELVNSILSSAEMLQRQLENLFRLVEMESGARALRLRETTAERLVQEAIQLAGHPGIQYKVSPLGDALHCDFKGLARSLANLIDNAVKFSPATSLVKVAVREARLGSEEAPVDAMAISVLDRGHGVRAEDRSRIFLPFEQGGDSVTGTPRGIGVGLYEAHAMAARHGGRLDYLPREGGGSEFRLTVPLRPAAEPRPAESVEETREVASV